MFLTENYSLGKWVKVLIRVMEAISTTIKVIIVGYFLLEERLLSIPFISFKKGILLYWKKIVKVIKKRQKTRYMEIFNAKKV